MIFALGLWTAMACVPIEGDRILARDLAAAEAAIARWPPESELGYSPAPGLRRVLRAAELRRLAARQQLDTAGLTDICVERPTAPLVPGVLLAALALAAGDPGASIEILDWSRYAVPRGPIEFPLTAAVPEGNGPQAPILWKGFVKYGERGRFSIWVRARIAVHTTEVFARADLAIGRPIQPEQLQLATVLVSPFAAQTASSLSEVVGRIPRRPIPAGSPILAGQLALPVEIHAGDAVTVRVTSGRAGVKLEAVACGEGHRGDFIPVKNPVTGKTFRARVEAAGRVSVIVPGLSGPVPAGEE